MSEAIKKSKKVRSDFLDLFKEVIDTNATLFTVATVALVIFTGVTLVDNPSNWWMPAIGIVALFLLIFIFMNARVVLKVALTVVTTIILAAAAFRVGGLIEPLGAGAFVWMLSILAILFVSLSLSYVIPTGQSKWGTLFVTQIIAFAATYVFSMASGSVGPSAAIGAALGVTIFALLLMFGGKSRYSKKKMPESTIDENLANRIIKAGELSGFEGRYSQRKKGGSVILWSNNGPDEDGKPIDRAYLIHPITMDAAFSNIAKKGTRLGYSGKNINAWLISLVYREIPYWKSRNADIFPILLDLNNRNGRDSNVIGVGLPDTKSKLGVGVYPGKLLKSDDEEALSKAFTKLEASFSEYISPITEKQKKALEGFG